MLAAYARRAQALVYLRLCRGLFSRIDLRLFARRLTFWRRRGDLKPGRAAAPEVPAPKRAPCRPAVRPARRSIPGRSGGRTGRAPEPQNFAATRRWHGASGSTASGGESRKTTIFDIRAGAAAQSG